MPSRQNRSVQAVAASTRPRFGRINTAVNYSGIGRSKLYNAAAANPGLFRKNGLATLVDFDVLDKLLDSLPLAKVKPPNPPKAA
jgi:hypothetical protein